MNRVHPVLVAFFTVLTCILLVDMFGKPMATGLILLGLSCYIGNSAWKKAEKKGRE